MYTNLWCPNLSQSQTHLVFEPTFQDLFLAKTLLHLMLHFLLRPTKGTQPLQKPLRYRRAQNRRLEHVPLRDVDDRLTKEPSWPFSFLSTCFNSICCFSSRGLGFDYTVGSSITVSCHAKQIPGLSSVSSLPCHSSSSKASMICWTWWFRQRSGRFEMNLHSRLPQLILFDSVLRNLLGFW